MQPHCKLVLVGGEFWQVILSQIFVVIIILSSKLNGLFAVIDLLFASSLPPIIDCHIILVSIGC